MANIKKLSAELLAVEEPLLESYKELQNAATGKVATSLCASVFEAQRSQLEYLRFLGEDLPAEFVAVGVITANRVKLRQGPGGTSPLITELTAGLPVIVMSWSGYWAAVQIPGGQKGYVFRDYVRVDGEGKSPGWQRPSDR